MVIQLQIDFSIPFELTPTKEEIDYTVLTYGVFDVPDTEVKIKRKKKSINQIKTK